MVNGYAVHGKDVVREMVEQVDLLMLTWDYDTDSWR